jgi:hypothetical protein
MHFHSIAIISALVGFSSTVSGLPNIYADQDIAVEARSLKSILGGITGANAASVSGSVGTDSAGTASVSGSASLGGLGGILGE